MDAFAHISNPRARQIYGLLRHLIPNLDGLPIVELSSMDRQVLGGYLFAEGPEFVEAVGKILTQFPELFDLLRISGPDLLAGQERAEAWKMVCAHLEVMLQLATDSYLFEQGTAIQKGLLVLKQVDGEAELPLSRRDDQAELRQVALWRARRILEQHRARAQELAKRARAINQIEQIARNSRK